MDYNFHNSGLGYYNTTGLYGYDDGLNAPMQTVGITLGELVRLLKSTPENSPYYLPLIKIATAEGLLNSSGQLNGFFGNIGKFISKNVSSGLKDIGKVAGKVIQIAAPLVSAVTGIPVEGITGIVGKFGNMIGGDLGNSLYSISNGGVSMRDERTIANQAQMDADNQAKADAYAQQQAQANANAQTKALQMQSIGYKPTYQQPVMNFNPTIPQINTIAQMNNTTPEVVKQEIANKNEITKAKGGFQITTPIAIAGVGVLGLVVYLATKK